MLNPSTANAYRDDNTVRRCVRFAFDMQCGGVRIVNLFAVRGADPSIIRTHASPVGEENDRYIEAALRYGASFGMPVIAAWGPVAVASERGLLRIKRVVRLSQKHGVQLQSFGTSNDGSPRHPLFLRKDAKLRAWVEPT